MTPLWPLVNSTLQSPWSSAVCPWKWAMFPPTVVCSCLYLPWELLPSILITWLTPTPSFCPFKKKKKIIYFSFGHAAQRAKSYFPNQGLNLCPLQWKLKVLTTGPPGKSQLCPFLFQEAENPKVTVFCKIGNWSAHLSKDITESIGFRHSWFQEFRWFHEASLGLSALFSSTSGLFGTPAFRKVAQQLENPLAVREMQEMWIRSLSQEDSLEEGMAAHSSILAWRIPWTGAWQVTVHGVAKSWTWLKWLQSILKEISAEYLLEGLMLKLQYFGHLMWRTDSLEKTLMLGKIEGRRRRGR